MTANERRSATIRQKWLNGFYANRRENGGARVVWTPEMIATAQAMKADGIGQQRIADRIGVHRTTYVYWLRRTAA